MLALMLALTLQETFDEAVKTPEGKIVLNDRAEKEAERLRQEAEKTAVADFFKKPLPDLRGGYKAYEADLKAIEPFLKDLRDKLAKEPAVNRQLKRFLEHEHGPGILYQLALASKVRPKTADFLKELGGYIVKGEDGAYGVAEARIEELKPLADVISRKIAALDKIAKIIGEFKFRDAKLAEAAKDRLFISVILEGALKKETADEIEQTADVIADELDRVFPDGELPESKQKEVDALFEKYEKAKKSIKVLREPAHTMADRMRKTNELDQTFAKFLREDWIVLSLSQEMDVMAADPVKALEEIITKAIEKKEDGTYSVKAEQADEVSRSLSTILREFEKKQKELKPYIQEDYLLTPYGIYSIEELIKAELASKKLDGEKAWREKHFENGKVRPGSEGEIEKFLKDVERIRKQ
jgi:hypothetical protein